jgi:hypothetical protein
MDKVINWSSIAAGCVFLASVGGCNAFKSGSVARQQATLIRELQIQPLFPPREDVRVGDVYVDPDPSNADFNDQSGQFLPIGMFVAALDLHDELDRFYSLRESYPQTSSAIADSAGAAATQPFRMIPQVGDSNRSIFQPGKDVHRLRLVGFPAFSYTITSLAEVSGAIPTDALTVAFGGAYASNKTVSFSAPSAELAELPVPAVASSFQDFIESNDAQQRPGAPVRNSVYYIRKIFALKDQKDSSKNGTVPLILVTGVYYSRAIDITIASQEGGGLGLAARLNPTKFAAVVPAATQPAATTQATNQQATYVDYLNSSLNNALSQNSPGVQVKFVYADDNSVVLRRTFDRPVAIGYRALSVVLPSGPGSVTFTQQPSGPHPMTPP